ncbi:hypothetical protein ES695_19760 [Candidatus Atribacteria bacterium 1244-E10-H5-B2]|nr:MAG: hypothetical protein ES695_19760 [Candidatus Atribacteria bacterium 1244-E10-H5-B2]
MSGLKRSYFSPDSLPQNTYQEKMFLLRNIDINYPDMGGVGARRNYIFLNRTLWSIAGELVNL